MIHWCGQETALLVSGLGFFGTIVGYIRAKLHHWKIHRKDCKKHGKKD